MLKMNWNEYKRLTCDVFFCVWCRLSCYCFFFVLVFLPLLHNHHRYPRRPRGSQSGQEKRRDESFLADWLPLGLQECITTVPPLKGRSQRWSIWSGRDLDQSQKMPFFLPKFNPPQSFSAPAPGEKNLFFLSGKSAQKCLIISPSSWAICTWLRGTSGFLPVPVDIVMPTISFAFEIGNHNRLY